MELGPSFSKVVESRFKLRRKVDCLLGSLQRKDEVVCPALGSHCASQVEGCEIRGDRCISGKIQRERSECGNGAIDPAAAESPRTAGGLHALRCRHRDCEIGPVQEPARSFDGSYLGNSGLFPRFARQIPPKDRGDQQRTKAQIREATQAYYLDAHILSAELCLLRNQQYHLG